MKISDPYGFGAAADMALSLFEDASRATGRTTRLIQAAQHGDIIVVPALPMVRHVERMLREAGKEGVRVLHFSVHGIDRMRGQKAKGTVYFDSTWVLAFYRERLRQAGNDLEGMSEHFSGIWPPHSPPPPSHVATYFDPRPAAEDGCG